MKGIVDQYAAKLCREVRDNDDRLGRYSDHEGDDDGPTLHLWTQGYKLFKSHCLRSIRDHETAIATMKKLLKLNEARKSDAPPAKEQP